MTPDNDERRQAAEAFAAAHPECTLTDDGDGRWRLIADDGYLLDRSEAAA